MRVVFSGCGSCYGASAVPRRSRLRTHVYGGVGFSAVPGGFAAASDRGLTPAPVGDTWAQIIANYSDGAILDALCWKFGSNACTCAGTAPDDRKEAASILASAKENRENWYSKDMPGETGGERARNYVEDSLAYWSAAGCNTIDLSSASSQGLSPAKDGDTWAQLYKNYSKDDICKAIAWGGYREGGGVYQSEWDEAVKTYDRAVAGDLTSQRYATAQMAYWVMARRPAVTVIPDTSAPLPPGGSPGINLDAALTECDRFLCPSMPSFAQKACQTAADKCREGINEAAEKGGAALNTALNNVLGGKLPDGSPPSSVEEEPIPWWAWLAGAGAAAMIVKVLVKKR